MSAGAKPIKELVIDVSSNGRSIDEREEAFREIVSRFQDLAYACAYAVLKNFSLAEEVAQQAFITAWQKLDQLSEPEAFPGWFRRIVINECHRLTRGKKLRFVPIESALEKTAADPGSNPLAQLEFGELRGEIRRAIDSLPENERLVTSLFYISEYSQKEVAEFLELPVSTVVKRLYTARQRLKQRMIEMFKGDIKRRRPSRNDSFAEQVGARLRPYSGSDWTPISKFAYAVVPDLKQDEEAWLRNRNRFDESKYTRRHYIAEENTTGNILGYGSIEQTVYLPQYRLFLVAEPRWLSGGVGDLLLDRLMTDLSEANAITVWHRTFAHQQEVIDFLLERGFVETKRVWDLRLDVPAMDRDCLRFVSDGVAEKGITIASVPEELQRLGDLAYHKLHEFLNSVKQDDPERQPFTPAPFESVVHWFGRKYVLPDACFIAKYADEYIGFTDLNHIEPIPGGIMHGFTGVSRNWRRQGIGTALKLGAIDYAREHGYRYIRAFNLPSQEAARALNEKLGFKRAFGYVTLEKFVKPIAEVDDSTLESYAGKYKIDASVPVQCGLSPDLTLTIRLTGNRLISELRDMQDELFAESNNMFFTDHHYARFEFTRDQTGAITGLVYHEDGHQVKATKST